MVTSSGNTGLFRVGMNTHTRHNVGSTRGHRLGTLFHFNQTHTAVTGDTETLVIAETGNHDALFVGSLENGIGRIHLMIHPLPCKAYH